MGLFRALLSAPVLLGLRVFELVVVLRRVLVVVLIAFGVLAVVLALLWVCVV